VLSTKKKGSSPAFDHPGHSGLKAETLKSPVRDPWSAGVPARQTQLVHCARSAARGNLLGSERWRALVVARLKTSQSIGSGHWASLNSTRQPLAPLNPAWAVKALTRP